MSQLQIEHPDDLHTLLNSYQIQLVDEELEELSEIVDLNIIPSEGFIGCEKLQSPTEVQILEEQIFLSKLVAPNFKGQVNVCSHLFVQNLLEKHSSLVSHTISTANKVKKQESLATFGRDTSRGRQFNSGY